MDKLAQPFLPPSRVDLARELDFNLAFLRVRPSRREVDGGGERHILQRRVMQVLVALAHSTNQVVSQRELILRCWGGLSVTDDAIGRCIAQLRRLAAGWPDPPFEIETIAGVGYRLAPNRDDARGLDLPPRPDARPCVAVIPFANLSNDPDQAYFADGMVEDIVASLSRFKAIRVLSTGGNITANGQRLNPREAARELGVDYLMEGSVRREGARIRITVHLKDARRETELWTRRFDEALSDVFALQDRVAECVAGAVEPVLQEVGIQNASQRPTSNLDSYDLYLRALPLFRLSRKAEMLAAIGLLERALELDPTYAPALGQSAVCHRQVVDHDWSDDTEMHRRRGLEYAERALAAAPDNARVLALAAAALPGLEDSVERALALCERAIALNPASTFVWLISGSVRLRAGQPDLAAQHLERALSLDPISPMGEMARMYLALCRFQQQRYEEALSLFGTTTLRLPISHAIYTALCGHLGRTQAARDALSAFESLSAGPIEKFARLWFPGETYRTLFLDGIRSATAPDSHRLS